jgi:hypothetical protein
LACHPYWKRRLQRTFVECAAARRTVGRLRISNHDAVDPTTSVVDRYSKPSQLFPGANAGRDREHSRRPSDWNSQEPRLPAIGHGEDDREVDGTGHLVRLGCRLGHAWRLLPVRLFGAPPVWRPGVPASFGASRF